MDASSASPSASRNPGRAATWLSPHLAGAQHRQHQVDPGLAGRRGAKDMQAVADLDVLDLAEPAVDVQDELVELLVVRPVVQAEVVVHPGGLDQGPDLRADRGQLRRVERGDVRVLVEQLLEPGDVAVGLGAGHRRDQVVDEGGVRAPFRLCPLTRVVDQERVNQRQVAERRVGAVRGGHADVLAGQPFEVAVLADVHDRVRAEAVGQPPVRGQIVVARRQVGVVIDGDRVGAEAARRLHHDDDVLPAQRGEDDVAGVHVELARRRPPQCRSIDSRRLG
nr:hypothetical protein GCM10020092_022610 [Actinoplanes digitatis]